MKRLQVLFLAALSSSLFLFGCGKDTGETDAVPEPSHVQEMQPGEIQKDDGLTVNESEETDMPPEKGMVRSRITNEWVDESVDKTRPIAVLVPNSKTASHYCLSKASVLYECSVENDLTRLMAIYDDWKDIDKL